MEPSSYYYDRLYPFQDEALSVINAVETDFYLTGGTALSPGKYKWELFRTDATTKSVLSYGDLSLRYRP